MGLTVRKLVTCDSCGEKCPANEHDPPPGYIRTQSGTKKVTRYFCCWKCLSEFATLKALDFSPIEITL